MERRLHAWFLQIFYSMLTRNIALMIEKDFPTKLLRTISEPKMGIKHLISSEML